MSSLYKLSISGIRSFSPKDNETIQFGSPLTLICGQNGCGKTTIIECLKYATTGDLPPNSKGGAFVNDPAIADRLLVNAEIKLGFVSVDGKSMTVTRNMQLARRRAGRGQNATNTFKTLEGQLAVITNGQKTAISTKNLELDTRVPLYLGASKAILEYVMFCHQDESLWPLSEASVLKKRFDEIFEALKFTKVLDNLKTVRKDMASDIKLIEQSVQHMNLDKGRAARIKKQIADSEAKVDGYTEEIAELTVQIEKCEKDAELLLESNQNFQATISEHDRLQMLMALHQSAHDRIEKTTSILAEDDEELGQRLANFEKFQDEKLQAANKLGIEKAQLEKELAALEVRFHKLTREEGSLVSKQAEYEATKEKLEVLTLQQQKRLGGSTVSSLMTKLKSELTQHTQDATAENEKAVSELLAVQDRLSRTGQAIEALEEQISRTKLLITELTRKLTMPSANDESLELEKLELDTLRNKLEKFKLKMDPLKLLDHASVESARLAVLEAELDRIMQNMNSASKLADQYSRVEILEEARDQKESLIKLLVSLHDKEFKQVCGTELNASVEVALESKQREIKEKLTNFQQSLSGLESELSSARAVLEKDLETLKGQKTELKTVSLDVLRRLGGEPLSKYQELIAECEENFKNARANLDMFTVTRKYQSRATEFAQTNKCCSLCKRGFSEPEAQAFIKSMQQSIATVTKEKLQEDYDTAEWEYQESVQLNALVPRKVQIEGQIAELGKMVAARNSLIDLLGGKISVLRKDIENLETENEGLQALKPLASSFARASEELIKLTSQIDNAKAELASSGSSRMSIGELQKLYKEKSNEIRSVRDSIREAQEEAGNQQRELGRLDGQIKDKQIWIAELQNQLREATEAKKLLKAAKENLQELEDKMMVEKLARTAAADEKQRLHNLIEKQRKQFQEIEGNIKEQIEALTEDLRSVETLGEKIKYFEEEVASQVSENLRDLKETGEALEKSKALMAELENQILAFKADINDASKVERNIRDNLELRHLAEEVNNVKHQLIALDFDGAVKEKATYQKSSEELREKLSTLNAAHSGKVGEVKQVKAQIGQLQSDLETEFKDIDNQYHLEWIKLQTNMLVMTDLQTYSQALDKAIMKYHSMKMDEINRILRELWNQTYKGTDIDGIEIKCDVSPSGKGRSYNYRVVMHKRSSELDMRGRCSAGQKVLTSILIRLALAECFGTNCGMIALDEPTTNLDVENAELLAIALNNIIEFRKKQRNFQLIVITHDEKFLSHINGGSYTDNFYRVERDENQHSVIKSLPIHLMQGD